MHISKSKHKQADWLAKENLDPDHYHAWIKRAALILCDAGMAHYTYSTQYGTGSTDWFSVSEEKSCTVTPQGNILLSSGVPMIAKNPQKIFALQYERNNEPGATVLASAETVNEQQPEILFIISSDDFKQLEAQFSDYKILVIRLVG